MGFGTLFIGYFLLLNITNFGYTDLISGLVMLLGLYKLSSVNRQFKLSFIFTSIFSLIGAAELFLSIYAVFMPTAEVGAILAYFTPIRYLIIGVLSAFMLLGIRDVAGEVGIKKLMARSNISVYFCLGLFFLTAVFDLPLLDALIAPKALIIIALILLVCVFTLIAVNLVTIYTAYMRICMPEDLSDSPQKQSKFGFVNKFRAHEEERQREYAEYKLSKMKNKKKRKK